MSSVVNAIKSRIASDWIAATPPSRTETAYKEALDRGIKTGKHADRVFWFMPAERIEMTSQCGDKRTVSYNLDAVLRLSHTGRGIDDLADAIENESTLLMAKIEIRTDWVTDAPGTLMVQTAGTSTEFEAEEWVSDALVTMSFELLVEETDT